MLNFEVCYLLYSANFKIMKIGFTSKLHLRLKTWSLTGVDYDNVYLIFVNASNDTVNFDYRDLENYLLGIAKRTVKNYNLIGRELFKNVNYEEYNNFLSILTRDNFISLQKGEYNA